MRRQPADRYAEKIDVRGPNDCWEWTAARFDKGYGAFRLGDKQVKAHRFGYELHVGPIPEGRYVCHTCDNPPCQNPRHWFLGSHADNAADRERKGRGGHPPAGPRTLAQKAAARRGRARGERDGNARLTEPQVLEIRARYAAGERQDRLAAEFGVTQVNISCVVRRKTWRHI
jgi:hypothetical protein